MINSQLINPKSIVVVGGSDNLNSPGGKILENLLKNKYKGKITVVNPKKKNIRGLPTYKDVSEIPEETDLAIIAVSSKYVEDIVKTLTEQKNTKAFIIISAGFSDAGQKGRALEERIVRQIEKHQAVLLGPNNIGLINTNYAGVFTSPVPALDKNGVDLISGSGATAVFIMEAAMKQGLRFNSIWTVGNSAQMGIEEVLEYMDQNFDENSPKIKLLYIENIRDPKKLLKHSRSLIKKGAKIVAIKAGNSEAGNRAASSHTGALSSPGDAVEALFQKAGIIRANGRNEMIQIAGVLHYGLPKGKNILVVTHAGGPGVMLTDTLEKNGLKVPELKSHKTKELLSHLHPGSSVANPIDFLATGTAEQLDKILEFGKNSDEINAMAVIFGSPGLFDVYKAYEILDKHIKTSSIPIYPILPSVINVADEIEFFHKKNHVSFPFEVLFGKALSKAFYTSPGFNLPMKKYKRQNIISNNAFLTPEETRSLLEKQGFPLVEEFQSKDPEEILSFAKKNFPVVMKVVGPLHKSDVGGVILDINTPDQVKKAFETLISIPGAKAVMVQKQISGYELYVGAKKEEKFGHLIYYGMGGVFIEIFKDVSKVLSPTTKDEIHYHLKKLKSYPVMQGIRGKKGIDIPTFIRLILKLDALLLSHPEIEELDFNPVIATGKGLKIVDARIKIN